MSEIKNCPLCGGKAMVSVCEMTDGWMGGVECTKCGCCVVTDGLPTPEEAKAEIVEWWNKRVEPVKRGKWIETSHKDKKRCSVCDRICFIAIYPHFKNSASYCPNCGAKMGGDEE